MSKLTLLTALMVLFALKVHSETCSCEPPGTPQEELELHDAVFVGKVFSIELDTVDTSWEIHRVQFLVDRYWKGVTDDTTTVLTTRPNGANCGVFFDADSSYLVYASTVAIPSSEVYGLLSTDLCTRTTHLSWADQDLAGLGPPVVVGVGDNPAGPIPETAQLFQNYPNPFNPGTEIRFDLAAAQDVILTIHNVRGQKIKTLVNEKRTPGSHVVLWDGTNGTGEAVPSGVYFYRFRVGNLTSTKKMLLVR